MERSARPPDSGLYWHRGLSMTRNLLGLLILALTIPARGHATNLLVNGGAEAGDLSGWTDPLGNGFNIGTTTVPPTHPPFEGSFDLWAGETGPNGFWNNELRQDVDVSSFATSIDAGTATSLFVGWGRSAQASGPIDAAEIQVVFLDSSGVALASFYSGVFPPNIWTQTTDARTIPTGVRTIRVRLLGERPVGGSTDAFFDALSLSVESPISVDSGSWGAIKARYN